MSIATQTAFMDAIDQAGLVAKGDVSASELLEAAIERAGMVNERLNDAGKSGYRWPPRKLGWIGYCSRPSSAITTTSTTEFRFLTT